MISLSLWIGPKLSVVALILLATWLVPRILKVGRRERFLPPGPPTIPVLGNVHMLPTRSPHTKFAEWGLQYGGLYSLKISSGTAVVVNSMEVAKELMDKRSALTADRPKHHMVDKVTNGLNLALARYSDTWRDMRKAAHTILTPKAVVNHLPIQRAETVQVLHDFLTTPDDFFRHIGRYANSVIMSVLFGKRCPRFETPESTAFFESMEIWNRCVSPVVPPVDLLPFLDYIPERWAWWKGLALDTRAKQRRLYFGLLDECEKRMAKGEENGSYMEEVLVRQKELGLSKEMIGSAASLMYSHTLSADISASANRYLGGVLLEGGSDTTSSFLKYLLIVLIAFPHVQRKAQAEMDRVVGHERIPNLADLEHLPYIRALIKEVHRFRPVAPLVPHAALADIEYRGYMIPRGTTIFVNTYGIYHNPDHFDDPETFNPDRYLLHEYGIKKGVDPTIFRDNIVFGYGRRSCPGIHLAETNVNLNTMNLIWAFNFESLKDNSGHDIPVNPEHYDKEGLLPTPLPFKCHIQPRNQNVATIIKQEYKEATETFVKFERNLAPADQEWVYSMRKSF
ncbi:hypothetical protein VNI00_013352 [Paramarasmius palmivorus]|uniref:Cytochrome P450 n=1 Tax=Paramarasmius palmivorus TaxID=297713 RepID=A0AAW0C1G1_9AGAR